MRDHDRSILFIANGGTESAAAERASRFAAATLGRTRVLVQHAGQSRSLRMLTRMALASDPDLVYCVDLALVPVAAGVLSSRKAKLIIDTGAYPSCRLREIRAACTRVAAARALEEIVYRRADVLVVRGVHLAAIARGHGARRVAVIPDGVDLDSVKPEPDGVLRDRLGLREAVTVGIAGCFTWDDPLGGGVGSELVRALPLLRDLSVHAVLIGGGPGLTRLRVLATELGVSHRLHILGWIPNEHYSRYLSLIDICLLTQPNNRSNWVRTTGKLPEYLASGRYILASAVGAAQTILPDDMLIQYTGRWDETYPTKLATRLRALATHPNRLSNGVILRSRAEKFSYPQISITAAALIDSVLQPGQR